MVTNELPTSKVPDAVKVVAKASVSLRVAETANINPAAPIGVGDLRIVRPVLGEQADHRVVWVRRVYSTDNFVEVVLVHTAPEKATAWDAICSAEAASAPYTVVVQTDLRGVVWLDQLGECVGRIVDVDLGESNFLTGIPLAGPLDCRWKFKEAEGAALSTLTADCAGSLLGESVTL